MRKLPLLLLPLALACSGSDDDRDSGLKPTGDAGTNPDATVSEMDAGSDGPDTGVVGPCNPLDGSGCANPNEFCVLQQNALGQCRLLPNQNPHEAACDLQLQDCAPGYMCIVFQGEAGPTCRKTCDGLCNGVTGMSPNYSCISFVANAEYGVCLGTGDTCTPANDMCPQGETCALVSQQGDTACTMAGTGQIGQACAGGGSGCAEGVCINLGTPTCYEGCDQMNPCASATAVCQGLQGPGGTALSFGICQDVTACDPVMDTCPQGEVCSIVSAQGDTGCAPAGNAAVGATCGGAAGNCVRGGICLDVGMGPRCYAPCDPMAMPTTCTMGMCAGLQGVDFGICN